MFYKGEVGIPIYHLDKIIGTVIARDKNKATVYLLTTDGVVPVRFRKDYFALFDKIYFVLLLDYKHQDLDLDVF